MSADRGTDRWRDADLDRFGIFVPVIMSAGLIVSLVTIVRDTLHWRWHPHVDAEVTRSAAAIAGHVRTGEDPSEVRASAMRSRPFYVAVALTAGWAATYIAVGGTANYFKPGGYVADIAWLWSVTLVTTALLGLVAAVTVTVAVRWPDAPRWTRPVVLRGVMARRPDASELPPPAVGWTLWAAASLLVVLTLQVAVSPHLVDGTDERLFDVVRRAGWTDSVDVLDPLGRTEVAVVLAVVIGLVTVRCPVFAMTYVGAVVTSLAASNVLRIVVDRPGPEERWAPLSASYPSGHVVQAAVLAGFLSLAVYVWTRRPRIAVAVSSVAGLGVAGTAVSRVAQGQHWPLDALAGAILGLVVVLAGVWVLGHRSWHARCRACPWRASTHQPETHRGIIRLGARTGRVLGRVALVWGGLALAGFTALAFVVGLPRNPEGDSLGAQVEVPLQVGLLAVLAVGLVTATRWRAPGATLVALGGFGLGAVSGVAHPPLVAAAVATVFVVPAVGLWMSWQRTRTPRAIAVLAVIATGLVLLSGTAAGRLHAHYFGPAHPPSPLEAAPIDEVVWVWTGGVTDTTAEVRARLDDDVVGSVGLRLTSVGGTEVLAGVADRERIVRWTLDDLLPGAAYEYAVIVGGEVDTTRGRGSFHTFDTGPQSLLVAAGSCARTGSNGAVFDTIRSLDPDLYVAMGDLHYGNIADDDVGVFLDHYDRVLTAPAQAALYSTTPTAYVWDDHDYGPNDADASSPSRDAAREAYRLAVPHHPLPSGAGGAIYQAFTVGRIRFVMTDTRSERTRDSMLGDAQLRWLEEELRRSMPAHALVVWVNPDPWIAPSEAGRDDWGGYPDERRRIADVIAGIGTDNLVMLSGDAHMVALDDGTNSDYSSDGSGGFPVLHGAALDRRGNVKGGPYSHGAFGGAGQFATLEVHDDGGPIIQVDLSGRDWQGATLTSLRIDVEVPRTAVGPAGAIPALRPLP